MNYIQQVFEHIAHTNVVDGSSMMGFTLVIADPERDVPEIKLEPLGMHTSALTTELQD